MLRQQVFGHGDEIPHRAALAPGPWPPPMEGVASGSTARGQDTEELLTPGSRGRCAARAGDGGQTREQGHVWGLQGGFLESPWLSLSGSLAARAPARLAPPKHAGITRCFQTHGSYKQPKHRGQSGAPAAAAAAGTLAPRVPSTVTILTPRRLRDPGGTHHVPPQSGTCDTARPVHTTALPGTSSSKQGFDGESKQSSVTSLSLSIPNLNAAVVSNPGDANGPPSAHSPAGWTSHTRSTGRWLLSEGKATGWRGHSQAGSVPRASPAVPTPRGWGGRRGRGLCRGVCAGEHRGVMLSRLCRTDARGGRDGWTTQRDERHRGRRAKPRPQDAADLHAVAGTAWDLGGPSPAPPSRSKAKPGSQSLRWIPGCGSASPAPRDPRATHLPPGRTPASAPQRGFSCPLPLFSI